VVYLREDVGSVCCSRGQGSEEGGLPCCLDSMDHAQSQVLEVGGLAVGVNENKDIINPWEKSGEILTHRSEQGHMLNNSFPLNI